ncbi:MAG TPA: amino acid ABC transporter permease [Nitrospirae bacterium]|nr:putative glutamine ABC transporter permease protein GlnP [bacterium BMS3Abin10]HDK81361.1 amino acid ABC transporter permease [Nitrospirota bacterium]
MDFLIEQFGNWKFYLIGAYPKGPLGGLSINIAIALLCMIISFFIGAIFGMGRLSCRRYISYPCIIYIEFVRATPALLLVFWFFLFIPSALGTNISLFWSSVIALSIYSTAYQAEIVRGGILAVPRGQMEAALSSGMTRFQAARTVILPQAFRMMLPSFVSFFISLFKETSVIYIIGVIDLTQAGVIISQRQPDRMFASYLCMAIGFFVVCFSMSRVAKTLEKKVGILDLSSYRPTVCRTDLSLYPRGRGKSAA